MKDIDKDMIGTIAFEKDTWKEVIQTPISTPQISYMFDPGGAVLIEWADDGFLLTTFEEDSKGNYYSHRRFAEVKRFTADVDWINVRYLLYEILEALGIHSSDHHSTHLDIIVIDREGKRIDDGGGYED